MKINNKGSYEPKAAKLKDVARQSLGIICRSDIVYIRDGKKYQPIDDKLRATRAIGALYKSGKLNQVHLLNRIAHSLRKSLVEGDEVTPTTCSIPKEHLELAEKLTKRVRG